MNELTINSKVTKLINNPELLVGLPALRGTTKQVEWATQIRGHRLRELDVELCMARQQGPTPGIERVMTAILSHTHSAWWIEHRDARIRDLMMQVARQLASQP